MLSTGITVYSYAAGPLDHWTDNQLCEWMNQPSPPEIIEGLVSKRLISCSKGVAKQWGEASNTLDGSYSFTLSRFNPSEGSEDLGRGVLEILDGKISVAKESRRLKTSSTSYYDTFNGLIDKEGNIIASFEVNALNGKGSPRLVGFSGNINQLQIKGKFDDYFEMVIKIKPFNPIESVETVSFDVKEKEKDTSTANKEKNELFKNIKASDALDGSYTFHLTASPPGGGINALGYGTLQINNGKVTISKDSQGMVKKKYESFEGLIDKNGDIVASFSFSPCPHCDGMEDKSIVFKGNIDKLKLSGMYDDIKIYFYLVKK